MRETDRQRDRQREGERQRQREIAKQNFYATKRPIKIWDVNVEDIVVSKLVKTIKL